MEVAEVLPRALAGETSALASLIAAFTPVVQARAARALARRASSACGRPVRQELEDMTQEVLCLLFRDDGKILKSWDPARGMSLMNYVGLVAEREVGHILASGRRSPWALDPTDQADLEHAPAAEPSVEARLASGELFALVHARLREELSPKALELFHLLVVEEVGFEEAAAISGLSTGALYTWRSRLLSRARALRDEIENVAGASRSPGTSVRGASA